MNPTYIAILLNLTVCFPLPNLKTEHGVIRFFIKITFFSVFLFQLRCSQKSHTIQNQTINQFHHRTIGFSISIRITCIRSSHTSHNSITLFICLLGCCAYHTFSNINVVGNKQKTSLEHFTFLFYCFSNKCTRFDLGSIHK